MRSNLFFALWPDDETREAIAAASRALGKAMSPRGRWIGAHRYHLTLSFLGAFGATEIGATIARAIAAAGRVDAPAFGVVLDVAGSFRNRAIPWWLGCSATDARLVALWSTLDDALRAQSLPIDGNHVAHVSIPARRGSHAAGDTARFARCRTDPLARRRVRARRKPSRRRCALRHRRALAAPHVTLPRNEECRSIRAWIDPHR